MFILSSIYTPGHYNGSGVVLKKTGTSALSLARSSVSSYHHWVVQVPLATKSRCCCRQNIGRIWPKSYSTSTALKCERHSCFSPCLYCCAFTIFFHFCTLFSPCFFSHAIFCYMFWKHSLSMSVYLCTINVRVLQLHKFLGIG